MLILCLPGYACKLKSFDTSVHKSIEWYGTAQYGLCNCLLPRFNPRCLYWILNKMMPQNVLCGKSILCTYCIVRSQNCDDKQLYHNTYIYISSSIQYTWTIDSIEQKKKRRIPIKKLCHNYLKRSISIYFVVVVVVFCLFWWGKRETGMKEKKKKNER